MALWAGSDGDLLHQGNRGALARTHVETPVYMNPEWQANAFAAELLIPVDAVAEIEVWEVAARKFPIGRQNSN